jgi:Ca2+-binding EF-hand superfamily protein
MKRLTALPALAVALGFSAAALAQDAAPSFDTLDKNRDGNVSLDEASANDKLFVAFRNLDKNQDGNLTREEFAAYQPGR